MENSILWKFYSDANGQTPVGQISEPIVAGTIVPEKGVTLIHDGNGYRVSEVLPEIKKDSDGKGYTVHHVKAVLDSDPVLTFEQRQAVARRFRR